MRLPPNSLNSLNAHHPPAGAPGPIVIALAAEKFFWAVLDGSNVEHRWSSPDRQLGYLFESVLPIPIEHLQARYVRVPSNGTKRYIACGMKRDDLKRAIDSCPQALSCISASVPAFVKDQLGEDAGTIGVNRLNLLVGQFEPEPIQRRRRRLSLQILGLLLLAATIAALGFERRTRHDLNQIESIRHARLALFDRVLPPAEIHSAGEDRAHGDDLRLLAELRTLRQTRVDSGSEKNEALQQTDCTPHLASLLAVWPADIHVQTESLVVSPQSMTFRGGAPKSADIQALADAMQKLGQTGNDTGGWQVLQPQMNSGRDSVQATIQLRPKATAKEVKP